MKRHLASATIVALLLVGWGARAFTYSNEAGGEGGGEQPEAAAAGEKHQAQSAPEYIMHHLADSEEVEFEVPFPHTEGVVLHFSEWFAPLRIERVPGACSTPVDKAFAAFPGLGKWLDGCWDLRPTKATFFMWVAAAILLLLVSVLARRKAEQLVPTGRGQHIVEVLLLYVRDEIAVKNIGKDHANKYTPYLASIFFFILSMNWLGLIPGMSTPTGNLAITAGLAILTFLLTQIAAIRSAGLGGYLKHLTGGVPVPMWIIMIPVEFLGLFTKPFALTVRLFANMLAGHTVLFFLLALIFMLHPAMAVMAVPMATGVFLLEIFVGIVQAYIFTMLSALFIGQGVAMGHHGHEAHGEAHGH